jgi:hypothetical protein
MASLEWERSSDRPLAAAADYPQQAAGDERPTDALPLSHAAPAGDSVQQTGADACYQTAVERLFALLEENQVAITALAQAWRHTNRTLQLTQAQLAHTQEMLAVERRSRPS